MSNSVKTDDVIFNFFKQICDEKDDKKCVELKSLKLYMASYRDIGAFHEDNTNYRYHIFL